MGREEQVTKRWSELSVMDRITLRKEWLDRFNVAPPQYLSLIFMRKALIWHAQADVFGGLKRDTKKALAAAVEGKNGAPSKVHISPGNQLVREWNGRRYLVNVTRVGFELDGKEYKSLTAIARHITGAKWSGPRFFGLSSSKRKTP